MNTGVATAVFLILLLLSLLPLFIGAIDLWLFYRAAIERQREAKRREALKRSFTVVQGGKR